MTSPKYIPGFFDQNFLDFFSESQNKNGGSVPLLYLTFKDGRTLQNFRIESTVFGQEMEAEIEDVQIKATENDLDIFVSAEEHTQPVSTKQNSRKQSFLKILKNKKMWCKFRFVYYLCGDL